MPGMRLIGKLSYFKQIGKQDCGVCIRTCPEQALNSVQQGYRVQVGGNLGRHPRLGEELPGIQGREQMLHILDRCLALHKQHYRPGVRFGQVVAEQSRCACKKLELQAQRSDDRRQGTEVSMT